MKRRENHSMDGFPFPTKSGVGRGVVVGENENFRPVATAKEERGGNPPRSRRIFCLKAPPNLIRGAETRKRHC